MTYKGYTAVLEIDEDAGELFGRVQGTRHIISFQGATVEEARRSFEETIDAYLRSCEASGDQPDRPYSGKFNVRVPESTHRRLAEIADERSMSLNDAASLALLKFVTGDGMATLEVLEPLTKKRKNTLTPFTGSIYQADGTLLASGIEGAIRKKVGPKVSYSGGFQIDVAHKAAMRNADLLRLKVNDSLTINFRVQQTRAISESRKIAVNFISEGKPLVGD